MIIFLLIAAGFACVPAYRSLTALLRQIPEKNEDFDLSLVGSEARVDVPAEGAPFRNEYRNDTPVQGKIAATASSFR